MSIKVNSDGTESFDFGKYDNIEDLKNAVNVLMSDYTKSRQTLRDYFAAKALQGQMSTGQDMTWEQYAQDAYRMADAMLAERDK